MNKLPEPLSVEHLEGELDILSWESLESALTELDEISLSNPELLREYLDAWNEFAAIVREKSNRLRLNKARYTGDDEYSEKWQTFVRDIAPKLHTWNDRLGRKLVGSEALDSLKGTDYWPFVEQTRTEVELFEEDNVPLQREVTELSTKYGEISGAWTIEFDGDEKTFSEMSQYLESTDRSIRKNAWEAIEDRRMEDSDELDDLWDEMFEKRHQIALNAGFDNYRDYIFEEKMRDYEPEACFKFHELVEKEVRPLAREIAEEKVNKLGLETFKPWDAKADPAGAEGLSPFENVSELKSGVENMMRRLDDELGEIFAQIQEHMDLESRPNKEQGGFQMFMPASRRPFIFANATGQHSDITTLLHEAGHAFHSLASEPRMPMSSTEIPMEFCEVTSMSMEHLHYDNLDEFYSDPKNRERAVKQHLRRVPRLLLSVAQGDAFQQWLYTHPEHTTEERREKWIEYQNRFMPHIDWSDVPSPKRRTSWHKTLHFFKVPFYYIEYGFAELGALQVAVNAESDPSAALSDYKKSLKLGASRDTEGLFKAAGAEFVPSQSRLRELMDWVRKGLGLGGRHLFQRA